MKRYYYFTSIGVYGESIDHHLVTDEAGEELTSQAEMVLVPEVDALAAIDAAREEGRREGRREARRIAADLVRESVGVDYSYRYSAHIVALLALAADIEKGHCASVDAAWVDAIICEYRDAADNYGRDIERGEHREEK